MELADFVGAAAQTYECDSKAYRPLGFSIGANIVVRLQLRRPPPSASITDILRTAGAELTVHGEPGAGHNLTRTDVAQTAR